MSVVHFNYLSEKLGYHTNIYLILPEEEPAGTLYLLHGGGGNGLDWIRHTSIERYALEHNVAVVMPETDGSCFYTDMKYGYPYFTYLTKEVPAVVEAMFPVNKEASKRYVAGLSMGGYGAYKWAFHNPEYFAAAANLSGYSSVLEIFGEDGFAKHEMVKNGLVELVWGSLEELEGSISDSLYWLDKASEEKMKLPRLFAAIGTEDFSYEIGKRYLEYAKNKGIDIQYKEMPGGHEWSVWDVMIKEFLQEFVK